MEYRRIHFKESISRAESYKVTILRWHHWVFIYKIARAILHIESLILVFCFYQFIEIYYFVSINASYRSSNYKFLHFSREQKFRSIVSSCLLWLILTVDGYNVVRFCQELGHSSVISPATWIFSEATRVLYNIFLPGKSSSGKELRFCFLLCNLWKTFCQNWNALGILPIVFLFWKLRALQRIAALLTILICYLPNNIHAKISACSLAENTSINPKQCRKLKLSAKS